MLLVMQSFGLRLNTEKRWHCRRGQKPPDQQSCDGFPKNACTSMTKDAEEGDDTRHDAKDWHCRRRH